MLECNVNDDNDDDENKNSPGIELDKKCDAYLESAREVVLNTVLSRSKSNK